MAEKIARTRVVLATRNCHKLREVRHILGSLPIVILDLKDFPRIPAIEENGSSFRENAFIKARTVYYHTGLWTLADDSGLEVDALDGAPGIFSARYAGPESDYQANNIRLLEALKGVPAEKRNARFRCTVAIVGPEKEDVVEGIVKGRILSEPRGKSGFGYDPLFMPDGFNKTFAELGDVVKNRISHRAIAFHRAAEVLKSLLPE